MLCAILLLQATSLLARPLYLEEDPPELRTAEYILLLHSELENVHPSITGTKAKALELANELHEALVAGADFGVVGAKHSMARDRSMTLVLGTFGPGMLGGPLDEFLFSADVGDISEPFDTPVGIFILRRVETYAGACHILVAGEGEEQDARVEAVKAGLAEGVPFGELAAKYSDEADTKDRGGQLQIFERGRNDRLLKKAAFDAEVGEVVGPIVSPMGRHFVKRIRVEEMDPALRESKWVKARGILVSYEGAVGALFELKRTQEEAKAIAFDLYTEITSGEGMPAVAALFNDDIGGRERAGELGWIHRGNPDLPQFMEQLFLKPPGWLSEPIVTTAGYVILKRER